MLTSTTVGGGSFGRLIGRAPFVRDKIAQDASF